MDITKIVVKAKLHYHRKMLDLYNVANRFGIISDDTARDAMTFHTVNAIRATVDYLTK